jgi:hypothetical protein
VGCIVLPERVGTSSEWAEVIGIGPNVGKPCSSEHAEKYRHDEWKRDKRASRAGKFEPSDVEGKLVHIPLPWPFTDERCMPSPVSDIEFFIEESLPTMVYEPDDREIQWIDNAKMASKPPVL